MTTTRRIGRFARATCLLLVLVFAAPGGAEGQTLSGRVLNAETRRGVGAAIVEVFTANNERIGVDVTDYSGRFRVSVGASAGPFSVHVNVLGYARGVWPVDALPPRTSKDLGDLELPPVPVLLERVEVETRRSRLTPGRELIRRRQLLGKGTFFSGPMLKLLNPPSLSEYIAGETDLRVRYDEKGVPLLWNPHTFCRDVKVLLNQWPLNREFTVDGFTEKIGWPSMNDLGLDNIAAIEVYNNMRDLPAGLDVAYGGGFEICAVVNIWTWDSY